MVALDGTVAGTARSGNDGYYILQSVKPGRYSVRVNPKQLDRLELRGTSPMDLVMGAIGEFVSDANFVLRKR